MLTGVSWEGTLAHPADLESYMGHFEHSDSCDSQDMRHTYFYGAGLGWGVGHGRHASQADHHRKAAAEADSSVDWGIIKGSRPARQC